MIMIDKCNPADFLNVTNHLLSIEKSKNEPVFIRTAIGRAYYASFLSCWEKLSEIGINIENDSSSHQNVITQLLEVDPFSADLLNNLRQHRRKADYYMSEKITYKIGTKCTKMSEEILRRIPSIKNK